MGSLDIPATVVALNGMTAVGTDPIGSDDDDTSYVHFQHVGSSFLGYNLDVNFAATTIPGPVTSVSLVTVAKGTDSRTAGGAFGARLLLNGGDDVFYPIMPLSSADWTETVTPLTGVTKEELEAGTVEYDTGFALLNDGSSGSTSWHTYFTYVALRVEYGTFTVPPPLRQYPRSDGLAAGSARRVYPPPQTIQASNRRGPSAIT